MMDIQTLRRLAITETHPALRRQYQAELAALPDVVEKVQEMVGLPPDIQNLKYRVVTEPNPTMRAEYALQLGDKLRAHSRATRVRKAAEWTNSELTVIAARSLVTAAQEIQKRLEAAEGYIKAGKTEEVGGEMDALTEQVANAEKYIESIHEGLDLLAATLDVGGQMMAAASASLRKEAAPPPELSETNGGLNTYRRALQEGMNMQNIMALYAALQRLSVYPDDPVGRFDTAVSIEGDKNDLESIGQERHGYKELIPRALQEAGLDGGDVQAAAGAPMRKDEDTPDEKARRYAHSYEYILTATIETVRASDLTDAVRDLREVGFKGNMAWPKTQLIGALKVFLREILQYKVPPDLEAMPGVYRDAEAGVEDQPRPKSTEAMGLVARASTRKVNKTLRPHFNKGMASADQASEVIQWYTSRNKGAQTDVLERILAALFQQTGGFTAGDVLNDAGVDENSYSHMVWQVLEHLQDTGQVETTDPQGQSFRRKASRPHFHKSLRHVKA